MQHKVLKKWILTVILTKAWESLHVTPEVQNKLCSAKMTYLFMRKNIKMSFVCVVTFCRCYSAKHIFILQNC